MNETPTQVEKVTVFTVHLHGFNGPCVHENIDEVIDEMRLLLSEGAPGDEISVKIIEMGREEIDSLSDFEGY